MPYLIGGDVELNVLDKIIGFVSPARAYQRMEYREAIRNYDAGDTGRLNQGWGIVNGTAEQINQPSRDVIRARARDLERNSDIAEAIIGPFERNVVRNGFTLQAKLTKKDGTEDEQNNKIVEKKFRKWCKAKYCDVTEQQTFSEMCRMAERRLKVDGGLIFIKTWNKNGFIPFQLQSREVDDLDTSYTLTPNGSGNQVVNGVEVDKYGKPIAYYLKKFDVNGWSGDSERIPADRVIYLRVKQRPSQIREMSSLAKTLPRVRDVNSFIEALSVKERILACLAVFVTKATPGGVGRTGKDERTGESRTTITPGMIQRLQPGETISAVNPSGQSTQAKEFISTQQRLSGAGIGLSYEATSRDMSQVNYSSARQGLLEDQNTYSIDQQFLIDHLCDEVYEEWFKAAVLAGEIPVKDITLHEEHEWIAPGWSWIDPLKEAKANETALNTGQDTQARICARQGLDWKEVLKQRALEQKYAKELGLVLGGDNVAKEQTKQTNSGAPTE